MRRAQVPPAVPIVPDSVLSLRWGWYGLSLFIPFAGILIALFLYDHDSREVRRIGRNCLLVGFLVWVVFPAILLFFFLLLAIISVLGWAADLIPAD